MFAKKFGRVIKSLLVLGLVAYIFDLPGKDGLPFVAKRIPDKGEHGSCIIVVEQ